MKTSRIILTGTALLTLVACTSGQKVRTINAVPLESDKTGFAITGITEINELELEQATPYIEQGLATACPAGGKILKKEGRVVQNGFSQEALYWEAVVECD